MKYHEKLFKKITGKDILIALTEGKKVYLGEDLRAYWFLETDTDTLKYKFPHGNIKSAISTVNELLNTKCYVEIPYDITKDLIENPGKWIAEYEGEQGKKYIVGFDYKECMAVRAIKDSSPFSVRYGASAGTGWVGSIPVGDLKKCVPL